MRHSIQLYVAIILLLIITPGTECAEHTRDEYCTTHTYHKALFQFDITNPASTYHILDTIKISSVISDTFHTQSAGNIFIPVDVLTAAIAELKIIPSGTSFELSYASNEFNTIVSTGTTLNNGTAIDPVLYQRAAPFNNLEVSFVPGHTGLYIFSVYMSNEQPSIDSYYIGNDYCTIYQSIPFTPISNQNAQYWDTLGISTLSLPGNNGFSIKKEDQNYFFVNVVQ